MDSDELTLNHRLLTLVWTRFVNLALNSGSPELTLAWAGSSLSSPGRTLGGCELSENVFRVSEESYIKTEGRTPGKQWVGVVSRAGESQDFVV